MHIETIAGKRRSTMNSRDAAYDEAEQLRQAIEESKKYGDVANGGTGNPKSKRRRDESEPYVQSVRAFRVISNHKASDVGGRIL